MIDNVKLERLKSERKKLECIIREGKSSDVANGAVVSRAKKELQEINKELKNMEQVSRKFLKTFDNDRDHINHAKSELRNYMYLLNVCHGLEDKILKLQVQLEGVKSPGATVNVSDGNGDSKEVRVQALRDKLQQYQLEYAMTRHRTDKVDGFLDNLSDQDRKIVTDVYINGIKMEKAARFNARSKRQLEYDIDEIMIEF